MFVEKEASKTFHAPYEWVFFTLKNPDLFSRFKKTSPNFEYESEGEFVGNFLAVKIHLLVVGDSKPIEDGRVDIIGEARMPLSWLLGSAESMVRYRYNKINSSMTSVDLKFRLETKGIVVGIYLFLPPQQNLWVKSGSGRCPRL